MLVEFACDLETSEGACQFGQRADETQVLEQLWPQFSRDPPHFLKSLPDHLLRLLEVAPSLGPECIADRIELEENAGKHLPDLIVKATGYASSLALLGCQRPPPAFAPLGFEAVEHLVERAYYASDLIFATDWQALIRVQQVDGRHSVTEPVERHESAPEQNDVQRERDAQADDDDQRFHESDRSVHRHRRDEQQPRDNDQHASIGGEDSPEQREACAGHAPIVAM